MRSKAIEMFGSRRIASGRGVEEAREVLSDVFLPVEFPSARPTCAVDLTLNAVSAGRMICGFMRFRDAVRIETAEAENFHIDIPTSGTAMMRAALGAPVYATSRTGSIFMPGRPVELDCSERFSQVALMIPRDELLLELENLLGERVTSPLEFRAELNLGGSGGQAIVHALRLIDAASAQPDGPLAHPLAAQRLEQMLVQSLLYGQPHNYSDKLNRPAPAAGSRPVSRAAELLRSASGAAAVTSLNIGSGTEKSLK